MSTPINNLTEATTLVGADKFVIYSSANGATRVMSATNIKTFMTASTASTDDKTTQYSAPSASGFNIAVTDGSTSVYLNIQPTGAFAAGTITLPALANSVDRQEVMVSCTQAVTTLTLAGNGSSVVGAPTTLTANGFFTLRFDAQYDTWYRVG